MTTKEFERAKEIEKEIQELERVIKQTPGVRLFTEYVMYLENFIDTSILKSSEKLVIQLLEEQKLKKEQELKTLVSDELNSSDKIFNVRSGLIDRLRESIKQELRGLEPETDEPKLQTESDHKLLKDFVKSIHADLNDRFIHFCGINPIETQETEENIINEPVLSKKQLVLKKDTPFAKAGSLIIQEKDHKSNVTWYSVVNGDGAVYKLGCSVTMDVNEWVCTKWVFDINQYREMLSKVLRKEAERNRLKV